MYDILAVGCDSSVDQHVHIRDGYSHVGDDVRCMSRSCRCAS